MEFPRELETDERDDDERDDAPVAPFSDVTTTRALAMLNALEDAFGPLLDELPSPDEEGSGEGPAAGRNIPNQPGGPPKYLNTLRQDGELS